MEDLCIIEYVNYSKRRQNKIMRKDLQKSLKRGYIDPFQLSTFQRIMLTTDGTLTEIMEAYLLEKIQVAKLSQEFITLEKGIDPLNLKKGSTVIERKILLQGKVSGTNFVYAESIIVPGRFDKKFQEDLEKSKKPIGQLWLEYRIETFREIISSGKEPAGEVADYFHISKDQLVLFRAYRVFEIRNLL